MENRKADISDWIDPPSDTDEQPEGYVEAVNKAIKTGLRQAKEGDVFSLDEVKREFGVE